MTWLEARLAATQRNEAARTLVETAKSMKDDLRDLTFDALAQKAANLTAWIARYRGGTPNGSRRCPPATTQPK